MNTHKDYTVNLNGTEPFNATKAKALAWLWCSRVEGEKCSIYTCKDPGAIHAENLNIQDFPKKETEVYALVMELFRDAELENCACKLRELLECFHGNPESVEKNDGTPTPDHVVEWVSEFGVSVELRLTSDFVLRRKLHQYEVGLVTGDDYCTLYDGPHIRKALLAFCEGVAKQCFQAHIKTMQDDETSIKHIEALAI